MGTNQSTRESHFQRTEEEMSNDDVDTNDQFISISNKMVERLVEDATLAGKAASKESAAPRGDYKEKIFMEKLVYLDENHSQRYRHVEVSASGRLMKEEYLERNRLLLTIEDLKATAARIELRTAKMVSVEPVCAECKQKVIDCYDNDLYDERLQCHDVVDAFSRCVKKAASRRLRARTQKDAREMARRERRVAHARVHELKDLTPPQQETTA